MGKRTKWGFPKIDWDREIRENGFEYDPTTLDELNTTELVEILNLLGVRAHSGMKRQEMINIIEDMPDDGSIPNPIDTYRDKIMRFIKKYISRIRDQMQMHCDGDCYKHTDIEVLACYIASREQIDVG